MTKLGAGEGGGGAGEGGGGADEGGAEGRKAGRKQNRIHLWIPAPMML
jgi:hypothetical protein